MKKSDTKKALLDAAEEAVRESGHDGFSYADLSNKVGIRKASIHYHFPGKADLLSSIMQRYRENLLKELAIINENTPKASDRLLSYISIYRSALKGGSALCLCVAFSIGQQTLDEQTREEISDFRKKIFDWLYNNFTLADKDGSISNLGNLKEETAGLISLVEGAQIGARFAHDMHYFDLSLNPFKKRLEN